MKKLIVVLVAISVLICGKAFADDVAAGVVELSFPIENNSPLSKVTIINTASIRPNIDKLTRWELVPSVGLPRGGSTEMYMALYDDTTGALTGELLAEAEIDEERSLEDAFPRHKKISNGVVAKQGAYTTLIIYFVRL